MTSKYEDAFNKLFIKPEDEGVWCIAPIGNYQEIDKNIETIREAIRKAEAMDRLIEAFYKDREESARYYVPVFFEVAANETAKFIEE